MPKATGKLDRRNAEKGWPDSTSWSHSGEMIRTEAQLVTRGENGRVQVKVPLWQLLKNRAESWPSAGREQEWEMASGKDLCLRWETGGDIF